MRRPWWVPLSLLLVVVGAFLISASPMPDVPSSGWFYGLMVVAHGLRLAVGFPNGSFQPDVAATRAQVFLVSLRILGWVVALIATATWFLWWLRCPCPGTDNQAPAVSAAGCCSNGCRCCAHCCRIPKVILLPTGVEADRILEARERAHASEPFLHCSYQR